MSWLVDTIKGRVTVVLVIVLSASHILGLWFYANRSDEAATILHDALLAEQIALVVRFAEQLPINERQTALAAMSSPAVRLSTTQRDTTRWPLPEGSRGHNFEHLLSAFLDRRMREGIGLNFSETKEVDGLDSLLSKVRLSLHDEWNHLPVRPMAEIQSGGSVSGEVGLADGSWVRFAVPVLKVNAFSPVKLGVPLFMMILSAMVLAAWILNRWTQPLAQFVSAAERLGRDIHSPPLLEAGPSEIRAVAHTLNLMQQRLQRVVEDRTAFAAAIAHDLGTPITRLHLRAHEIEDDALGSRMVRDLEQMRRMITATLEFARLEFAAEISEKLDLGSLVESVCDDYADIGEDVSAAAHEPVTVMARPASLRRAIANLIENAVKYGKRARVTVESRGREARITVADDGPGLPPHMLEEAFKPFRRINQDEGDTEGNGLGLSIARSVVMGMGGQIVLSNADQGGLQAIVTLPLYSNSSDAQSYLQRRIGHIQIKNSRSLGSKVDDGHDSP
jgi:signal transduction histidine kinase